MEPRAQDIIAKLGLEKHPEGGWYRQTWLSPPHDGQARGAATSILFLLEPGQRSHWHRIDGAELWLFQGGGPLNLRIWNGTAMAEHRLGPDILGGDTAQALVQPGEWQAAQALDRWALVACVVVPAFSFDGFELAAPGWAPPQ
jgi:predicted cupin superfamily sugar epimerase